MPTRSQRHLTQMRRVTSGGIEPVTLAIHFTGWQAYEDIPLGANLGTLSTVGTTGTPVFQLTNSDGDRVALTGINNVNVVRGATAWDYETHSLVTFAVSVAGVTPTIAPTSFSMIASNVLETILNPLTLSADTVLEGSPAGTVVGTVQGKTPGSNLHLTDTGNQRFALSGLDIVTTTNPTDYETVPSYNITITEIHADAAPRATTLTITVTSAGLVLAPLTLSANTIVEHSVLGTLVGEILGQTSGSLLELVDNAGDRFLFSTTIMLAPLTLSNDAIVENAAPGTFVGSLLGQTAGSTLELIDTAGDRFAFESVALMLAPLTLSANAIDENSAASTLVGAILGQTAGSTLELIDSAGGRFAFGALAPLTLSANTIDENSAAGTLVGAILGRSSGSTLTLFDSAEGRFGVSP